VTNEPSGDVPVIESRIWKEYDTIGVGKRPRGIHFDPSGKHLYVALSGTPINPPGKEQDDDNQPAADKKADGIGVIDVESNRLKSKLIAGSDPEQFSLSRDGRTMYISNEDANAVTVLDIGSGKAIKQIPVGTEPEGVTTSPDGKRVFVTSETTSEIHVIDTT
jgi:YVTN family beta-propeller protein